MDLERRSGETELDYHRRIVYGKLVDKTLSDVDYTEIAQALYGQPYSSDVARRMVYGSKRTLDMVATLIESSIDSDDVRDDLVRQRQELQKELVKVQTEKAEYRRWLREDARDEMFIDRVIESIRETICDKEVLSNVPKNIPVERKEREAALCLADIHFGKQFTIYGLRDEVINEYSPEIFYIRMERILVETIDIIRREGINTLRVYNLGDSVDGFIRHSQLWSLRYGVVDSAILFGNYMGNWLRELSRHVNVVYAQTDGNHDELRLLDGKKGQHLCESAGKIVRNCISIKNEDNPNFMMIENKTGLIFDTLCGFNILGVHGECKNKSVAIKEYSDIYGEDIAYLISGHMHHADYSNCGVRKGCIGVGSIVGSDDFSMSLRRAADPTASLLMFEVGKGKIFEYTYVLN